MKTILLFLMFLSTVFAQEDTISLVFTDSAPDILAEIEIRDYGSQLTFIFDSSEIVITDSILYEMTEDEYESFVALYITAIQWYHWGDTASVNLFGREKTIKYRRCFEIVCRKLIPEWVFKKKGE